MQPGNIIEPSSSEESPEETVDSSSQSTESFYKEDKPGSSSSNDAVSSGETPGQLSWEASEYIDHEKSAGWYGALIGIAFLIAGAVFLITRGDIVTTVVVVIAAVLFGIVAARRPRTLEYIVDNHGVTIGGKLYPYSDLKTFSLITETSIHSIQLLPLKRFLPPISVYFPPEQEEMIMNTLGGFLPYEQRGHDAFDRLMSRIRF